MICEFSSVFFRWRLSFVTQRIVRCDCVPTTSVVTAVMIHQNAGNNLGQKILSLDDMWYYIVSRCVMYCVKIYLVKLELDALLIFCG